ncbi:hypothetical protein F7725_015709, partial [Dissostichus mawsoni]
MGQRDTTTAGMSGRVGDLSPKQAEILTEFRGRIQDVLPSLPAQHDHYLLRFLRARSFNVQKSEAMIRKHVEFRRKMNVDTIISDWKPPEVIEKYVSGGMCGYDREGSPIWYDLGRHIESISLIYDCEGLGLKHIWKPAVETYGEVLTMFEENYPEGLKRVFIIKGALADLKTCLYIFQTSICVFVCSSQNVSRGLQSNQTLYCEETRRKINILGSNWQEELRKHVDPDQLPVAYGGNMTDPDGDPRCRTMINYGGTVPRSYYVLDSVNVQYDSSVTVSRGSVFQLEYDVTAASSLLRWQFTSDGADIGFGVYRRTKEGGVLPSERYNAHLVPEDSCLTCPEPGVYVLCFDNSYSILQSKKVSYKVEVLPPADGCSVLAADEAGGCVIESSDPHRQNPSCREFISAPSRLGSVPEGCRMVQDEDEGRWGGGEKKSGEGVMGVHRC